MLFKYKIVILLSIIITYGQCDWIQISQNTQQSSDVIAKNLENLENLKYEDLIHVVGPGFESEFQNFLNRQNHHANNKNEKLIENPNKTKKSKEICIKEQKTDLCENERNKTVTNSSKKHLNDKPKQTIKKNNKNQKKSSKNFFDFSNIRKYVQRVQETLVLSATSGIQEKVKLLENLKNRMLLSIGMFFFVFSF